MQRNLYLDIDGVISPHRGAPVSSWPDFRPASALLSYSPMMVSALNELITDYGLQPYWLTTWEQEARWVGDKIGLAGAGEWPWLPACGPATGADWEKFVSVQQHVDETRPDQFVWIDDNLLTEPVAQRWAAQRGALAIGPRADQGIHPGHLEEVRAYLSDVTAPLH